MREIDAFGAELIDRFGPLPPEVDQLLQDHGHQGAVPTRQRREGRCRAEGRRRRRSATTPSPIPTGLVRYMAEQASFAKVRPDMRIVFIRDFEDPDERLKATTAILRNLARIADKKAA